MNKLLSLLLILISTCLFAQNDTLTTFVTTQGKVHFFSASPIENIEATTNKAVCVFSTKTQKINAKILITSFVFKDKLMQEHFNENYLESDKYPYSVFNGEIVEPLDYSKDGDMPVTIRGTFEIHGVEVAREVKGILTIKNGQPISAKAKFDVTLADHNISIPAAVTLAISKVIAVDLAFNLMPYQKK